MCAQFLYVQIVFCRSWVTSYLLIDKYEHVVLFSFCVNTRELKNRKLTALYIACPTGSCDIMTSLIVFCFDRNRLFFNYMPCDLFFLTKRRNRIDEYKMCCQRRFAITYNLSASEVTSIRHRLLLTYLT